MLQQQNQAGAERPNIIILLSKSDEDPVIWLQGTAQHTLPIPHTTAQELE